MKHLLLIIITAMLLLCLFNMPYGYYQLTRFVATAVFAYLSYYYFKSGKEGLGIAFASLAILFQPLIKIALGRTIWNVVDVVVAAGLIFLIIVSFRRGKDS